MGSGPEVTEKLHHIKVLSSTLRHERDSNSELSWWQTLIAQEVVNPTTTRTRSRARQTLQIMTSRKYCMQYTQTVTMDTGMLVLNKEKLTTSI